jgi:hypothetical protein
MGVRQLSGFGVSVALHLLVVAGLTWLASRPAAAAPGARTADSKRPIIVAQAPARPEPTPPAAAAPPREADPKPADVGIHLDEAASTLAFATFTFDAAKIVNRATSLYPFLTRTFDFDRAAAAARRSRESLINPFAPPGADAAKPPLITTDAVLQTLIDRTWSRRHRWDSFQPIAGLTERYSADRGRLSTVLREYVNQNALQPYVDNGARDPRLWTQLGLTADHADFADFIDRYAAAHPSTKTTMELLFLLEKQAEASLDTLITLIDINPERDLRWTRDVNPDAFAALVAIRRYYIGQLARRGMTTRDALVAHYDGVRLAILTSIVRTTPDGYRESDARFLIGSIHWRQRRYDEATRVWAGMRADPRNRYAIASSELLDAIAASGGQPPAPARVSRILDSEQGRWISFSYDRLRQFGYGFDTF